MEQMIKRKKQILTALFVLIMLCMGVFAALNAMPVKAASGFVKLGDANDVPQVTPSVGLFNYNDKPAFCMQHQAATPQTGEEVQESTYGDDNIRKILYYGYGGDGQWQGFGDEMAW
ncbi:thioester domain-containing protein [Eubacterium aggregans]|uniref:thioester domain-containing protein n=1 Tax=Eubacterium aggregans TaxID=81409 RepID=UPI003F2F9390